MNHVPILLLYPTSLHSEFEGKYAGSHQALTQFSPPGDKPSPGEESVQETFTEEWRPAHLEEEELTFTYSYDDLLKLNSKVWLKWIGELGQPILNVLVVGCGAGREAMALGEMIAGSRVVGIDINLAVVANGVRLDREPQLDVVVCSLLHLPFPVGTFDLVYSQGVLHHNKSTLEAFKAIAPCVREGGHLFVWVYGLDDHLIRRGFVGVLTRINYVIEAILRPILSRFPGSLRQAILVGLAVVLHPLVLTRVRRKKLWHMKDTIHGLRDWLSPRYAHLHSYNEVIEWFEREGFRIVDVQSPAAYRDLFNKQLWGVGMTGRRVNSAGKAAPD